MYAACPCPPSPGFPCPFVDAPPPPLQDALPMGADPVVRPLATFGEQCWAEPAEPAAVDLPPMSLSAIAGMSIPGDSPAASITTCPAAFASVATYMQELGAHPVTPQHCLQYVPVSFCSAGAASSVYEPCVNGSSHQARSPIALPQRKDSKSVRTKARSYTKVFVGQLPASGDLEAWLGDLFGPYGVHEVQVRRNPRSTSAFVWCKSREMAEAAIKRYDGYKYACGATTRALCVETANACPV